MHCADFLEHYSEYRDGLIEDQGLLQQLRRHLVVCPRCMRYDARLARGVTVLRSLSEVAPSAGFRRRLAARLARSMPEQVNSGVPGAARIAVAMMLAAVAVLFLWPGDADDPRVEAVEPATPPPVIVVSPRVPPVGFADFVIPVSAGEWEPVQGPSPVQTAVFP